jgi:hypothetical protein
MSGLKIFSVDAIANTGIAVPEMFDYNHFGFEKKKNYGLVANPLEKGLLLSIEYYEYKTGNPPTYQYQNLLIKEEYVYIKQAPLFLGVTTIVKWYDGDDAIGYEKSFTKMFNSAEIVAFGEDRRSNLVADAKIYCVQNIPANIYDYLDYLSAELTLYIQGNTVPLVDKISASVGVKPYITQAIANTLVVILGNVQ